MERFELDKKISSTHIDKKLISQIQSYLKERLPKKLEGYFGYEGIPEVEFKVKIQDSLGEESLTSIDEFHRDQFPNDVKQIAICCDTTRPGLDIDVRFSNAFYVSRIQVDVRCAGAKEIACGICNEIDSLIKENETSNYLFHNGYSWGAFSVFLAILYISNIIEEPLKTRVLLCVVLMYATFHGLRFFSPYITFDTKLNLKYGAFKKWLSNGLAGVFIFGVIATYVKNIIF